MLILSPDVQDIHDFFLLLFVSKPGKRSQAALAFIGVWLVASGAPYWAAFPAPQRYALPPLYRFMAWLSRVRGVLPGRRLRFAGNEAPGVIDDWSRSALAAAVLGDR